MYCRYCGRELKDNAVFCTFCGRKQNEVQNGNIEESGEDKTKETGGWAILGGFIMIFVGIIMFAYRSSIKSELYRESVRSGWMGMYDEPFSVQFLLIVGVILIGAGVVIVLRKIIK